MYMGNMATVETTRFRKYTGLVPNAPYQSTLKITTGFTYPIKVPRDFEEWEYGICGPN